MRSGFSHHHAAAQAREKEKSPRWPPRPAQNMLSVRALGGNFLHRSPERSEAELTVREDLCNRRGVLHGGAVMALGDTLGGMTARSGLPDGGGTATIESKTNFFAAVPKGDTAHAVCIPLHRGRTTIVLETRITRGDDKLAAIVTQTQLIFGKDDEA